MEDKRNRPFRVGTVQARRIRVMMISFPIMVASWYTLYNRIKDQSAKPIQVQKPIELLLDAIRCLTTPRNAIKLFHVYIPGLRQSILTIVQSWLEIFNQEIGVHDEWLEDQQSDFILGIF
ncbi:hypothetical protein DFH06DRAFT_1485294 [Mycena polygramma]|nr:hypothetical protein DFH06DRAFT_1485294 [Mycena polygramma]